ncbi:MAG: response regulator [Deltaproteobacteria bacterium]|nr:response regulator [Deltaproteobacteria bacterium]MBW2418658.1 response regulator [Deltaproteobacteria bacterium]
MSNQQQLHVLVVDRDEESTLQLKETLSHEGYRVTTISDPSQAPGEVRNNRFQMVVLDCSPSNPEGADTLGQIRSIDDDLCVIVTTDLPTVEMAVATMKSQAFHYLQKPLDEDELRLVIREAIKEKGLLVDLESRLNSMVGQRIRELRHSRPLTLKQLANRTGLSVSLISQIELGKSAASMSTLHKLATALQTKMTYFFETV